MSPDFSPSWWITIPKPSLITIYKWVTLGNHYPQIIGLWHWVYHTKHQTLQSTNLPCSVDGSIPTSIFLWDYPRFLASFLVLQIPKTSCLPPGTTRQLQKGKDLLPCLWQPLEVHKLISEYPWLVHPLNIYDTSILYVGYTRLCVHIYIYNIIIFSQFFPSQDFFSSQPGGSGGSQIGLFPSFLSGLPVPERLRFPYCWVKDQLRA